MYDGVLWPPYLWEFTQVVGRPIHYAVLLPPLDVCLERVRTRTGHPFSDETAARHMWHSFDAKRGGLHTLDTVGTQEEVAQEITELVAAGTILQT